MSNAVHDLSVFYTQTLDYLVCPSASRKYIAIINLVFASEEGIQYHCGVHPGLFTLMQDHLYQLQ